MVKASFFHMQIQSSRVACTHLSNCNSQIQFVFINIFLILQAFRNFIEAGLFNNTQKRKLDAFRSSFACSMTDALPDWGIDETLASAQPQKKKRRHQTGGHDLRSIFRCSKTGRYTSVSEVALFARNLAAPEPSASIDSVAQARLQTYKQARDDLLMDVAIRDNRVSKIVDALKIGRYNNVG